MYQEVTAALRAAYDKNAGERDRRAAAGWKTLERQSFLELLNKEGKASFLEIGGGPGRDSLFFFENGLQVTCTDLSPEMIRLCRAKGLDAHVMDFLNLEFADGSFDAVFAMNCLMHVPEEDIDQVLSEIRRVMKPGGCFFYGVYGGISHSGLWEQDGYRPRRYFALYPDDQIKAIASRQFILRDFRRIELPESSETGIHFQRLILQKESA